MPEESEEIQEGIRPLFGSPGGKTRLAKLIVSYFPDHKTYVEPFCGGAAVFFAKKPSEVEVLNDKDFQIYNALKVFKEKSYDEIRQKSDDYDWHCSKRKWLQRKESKRDNFQGLFDFLYSLRGSFAHSRSSFAPSLTGTNLKPEFNEKSKERISQAHISNQDYKSIIKTHDSKDTLFYIDPPYESGWRGPTNDLNWEEFQETVKGIKGKLILSINKADKIRKWFPNFNVKTVKQVRTIQRPDQPGRGEEYEESLYFNFDYEKNSDWLSESINNATVKLAEIKDWRTYDVSREIDNTILADDFRLLTAKYSNEKRGEKTEYGSVENVIKTAEKTVKRILELGKITFHPEKMKAVSMELLKKAFSGLIKGGPYLTPPHGELIWEGKKKAIVKKAKLNKLEDMGILSSGKLAYGFLRCYEGEEIGIDEFKEREKEHRVTESELQEFEQVKWWSDTKKLYMYKIREFLAFGKPKKIEIPRGVQRWAKDVRFFESTFMPKDWDLQKISNTELIKIHAEIHDEARRFSLDTSKPPPEHIIDRHTLIIEEMRRRNLEHRPHTELDRLSLKWLDKTELTETSVKLSDLMNLWQEGFDVRFPLLSFVGGACVSGWGKDIDINVNWPSSDTKFLDILEFRLKSFVPPEYRDKIHLVPDYRGPFTNYVPFASLRVSMIPTENRRILKMSANELSKETLREQRLSDAKVKKQAELSRKENKINLFRFFIQPKGIKGYKKEEAYSIGDAIEKVKEKWLRDGKFPRIMVDQKFDGMRAQIHSDRDRTEIWSEDGGNLTHRFPAIAKEAKAQGVSFIADAEITGVKDNEHMGRSDVAGYAHAKTPVDDSPFTANVFDILYLNEDIHKKILSERRSAMEKLKSGKAIKKSDKKIVQTEKELKDAMDHFAKIGGSEGAMLKLWDSAYPLSGMTGKWMKFKKEVDIDAEVIEVHRVKGTDAYNYLCVARDGAKRIPVGRTYNVLFEKEGKPIQVPIGGIIRVAFVNVNKYTDKDTGEAWYNWWSPRAIEYREDKTRPDNVDTVDRLVKVTGGEVDEKKYPKRYRVALEKLKEGIRELKEYEDWLEESYPMLYDLDEYEKRLLEAIGEDELNEERKRNIKEGEDLNLFWDDYYSEGDLEEFEKWAEALSNKHGIRENIREKEFEAIKEQSKEISPSGQTVKTLWEHHWRGESVYADHRFQVDHLLNGVTLADSPGPGEVAKAKKHLGIEEDIDTETEARKIDNYFYEKKMWKFDQRMPEKKVLAFPKARQPVSWLKFKGKVDPGEVGATAEGPGFLYHVEKGHLKEFGTQKVYFKEYFEYGKKYKGRWVLRKIPARKEWEKVGKGKLVWMAWFAKPDFENQLPYLLTRRGRTKKDYMPPDGQSGISKEWREKIPKEFQWWKKGLRKAERFGMMDKAFNWLVENVDEFPFAKLKIREAVKDITWALSKVLWKGPTVVRGMPKVHYEMFLDFGDPKLKRYETESNPIFEDETVGTLVTENTKPDGEYKDWLKFEGEIPAEHPKNPNKELPMYFEIEDKGNAKVIEKTGDFIHLKFAGTLFKGLKAMVREDPKSDIWVLKKPVGPGGKL